MMGGFGSINELFRKFIMYRALHSLSVGDI